MVRFTHGRRLSCLPSTQTSKQLHSSLIEIVATGKVRTQHSAVRLDKARRLTPNPWLYPRVQRVPTLRSWRTGVGAPHRPELRSQLVIEPARGAATEPVGEPLKGPPVKLPVGEPAR